LRPDNFTPPSRTPWGGRRIREFLKADAQLQPGGPVGEAWELSVEPDFPSRLADGPILDEVLRADPALLGAEAPNGSTSLLVKLVDADDDLSVQIHPHDDDPALAVGFREGVSRQDVETAIDAKGDVSALMSFVQVSPGDLFLIGPGTPHAIGRGVLLLEPQRVAPGKRGVTYRYWDWNRKYDAHGQLDPSGHPRALHSDRALDVTTWEGAMDAARIDRLSHRAGPAPIDGPASLEVLMSHTGPLRSDIFCVQRFAGSGALVLDPADRLRSLTVLDGRVKLHDGQAVLSLSRGQTCALPACLDSLRVDLDAAHAVLCSLT
jgi:mannose-6-phosphate isomerase